MCGPEVARWLQEARPDIQRLEHNTRMYLLAMGASAAVVLLVVVLLSRRGAPAVPRLEKGVTEGVDTQSTRIPWWRLYAQWLLAPTTVVVLAGSAMSLLSHELVAVGVRCMSATLHHALATEPTRPLALDNAAWQAAVDQTWSDVDVAWADAEQTLTQAFFGWLNGTVVATHDVLHGALDLATGTVDDTLGSTPLHDPVSQFVQCVLGSTVHSVDSALQWAQAHAVVHLPRLPTMPPLPPLPLDAWAQHARTDLSTILSTWDERAMRYLALTRLQAVCVLTGVPSVLLLLAISITYTSSAVRLAGSARRLQAPAPAHADPCWRS